MPPRSAVKGLLLGVVICGACPACRDKPPERAASEQASQRDRPNPTPINAGEDDPQAPASFPRSQKDGPWIKGEPIRVYPATNLDKVLPPEEAARLILFRITSIARCVYQLPHSRSVPIAELVLISTETADDAYGILSCRSDSGELFRIGGETRVDRDDGLTLHCWQGRSYVAAHLPTFDPESSEELIRLLNHVVARTGREPLPQLIDVVPRDTTAPGRRWLVRNLLSLPPDVLEEVGPIDRRQLSEVLGLGAEATICVASYPASGTVRPNTVWVASYPSVKAAHDAQARYLRYIDSNPGDSVVQSTNLMPVQGMFLLGTWTAEEESMQYMLPRIRQLLPS